MAVPTIPGKVPQMSESFSVTLVSRLLVPVSSFLIILVYSGSIGVNETYLALRYRISSLCELKQFLIWKGRINASGGS